MALVDLIYIIIIVPVWSVSFDNLMGDDRVNLLTLYYFNSQPHCAPEIELFNYARSAHQAVDYVLTETGDDALYIWRIIPIMLYGCNVQDELRGPVLTKTLQEINTNASISDGYSVLLGPPLINDCDMVSQWTIAGDPGGTKMNQLYQISYRCYIFGSTSDFATFSVDSTQGTHFYPPINVVSVTVPWHTFIKALATFLWTSEWNRIAIFVDYNTINFDVSMLLQSASLTLSTTTPRQPMHIRADKSICIDMNFTELIYPLEESLDVILILGNAKLAISFLWQIQNLTRIKEGRIAIIHVNLGDMYAYDSLVSWKAALAETAPTLAAGLSLILFTALPINAKYEEDSYIYDEEINLSMAHAAAFAMRMTQLNNLMKGGDVPNPLGFFDSLRLMEKFRVPTLPGLDFFYKHDFGNDLFGLFDMLLFTLKQDITNMTKNELELKKPSDMFQLNYLIRYPYVLPQPLKPISWPGDGKGPMQTSFLITRCDFETVYYILAFKIFGFIIGVIASAISIIISRHFKKKRKCQKMKKLIFLMTDFDEKEDTNNNGEKDSKTSLMTNVSLQDVYEHDQNIGSQGDFRKQVSMHGEPVFIKDLRKSNVLLNSKLINYLATLRSIRHENINPFVGSFPTPQSFCLLYEFCQRRSLEEVLNNKSITFDWDFKLSLMIDLVRGMEYLHNSPIRVHGRLKPTNCLVSSRWVLKITDFGIPHLYFLMRTSHRIEMRDKLWLSPELLRDEELATVGTKPGDVYAFSLIMYEIFYFCKPYSHAQISAENVIQRVKTAESPPFRPRMPEKGLPPEYRDILKCCWLENPSLRPTFKAIRDHIGELTERKKLNVIEHMFEKLDKYSHKLELEVEKRKEELEIEKRKNEQLLCRMLPPCVAEALKDGITAAPEMYDEVSIYFSDIVGFTSIAAMSTPMEVVNLLNDLYTLFDSTIAKYDVYKVETIGDAYMVASGLPVRNGRRHANEVALTALDLLSVCGTFKIRHLPQVPLRVRIGLHSGPCVAGVVGLIMPRYCVFGDTVNQAQKMESSGAAFRIHVSERMKDALEEIGGYYTEFHGKIEFEGGITTNSYWLIGCDIFTNSLPEPPPLINGETHGLACVYKEFKNDC